MSSNYPSGTVKAVLACALALVAGLSAAGTRAEVTGDVHIAWKLEPNARPPHYAVVEPSRTNLNVAAVVLACENAREQTVLQLQLYLTDDGPLLPKGADASELKGDPQAKVEIDGKVFPVNLLFSNDYAVLSDAEVEGFAGVSEQLVDAMANGKSMRLRLDLLAEAPGKKAAFDSEAVIDLQANGGRAAIEAMRYCLAPTRDRTVQADAATLPIGSSLWLDSGLTGQ
jgi:hypothetical protein